MKEKLKWRNCLTVMPMTPMKTRWLIVYDSMYWNPIVINTLRWAGWNWIGRCYYYNWRTVTKEWQLASWKDQRTWLIPSSLLLFIGPNDPVIDCWLKTQLVFYWLLVYCVKDLLRWQMLLMTIDPVEGIENCWWLKPIDDWLLWLLLWWLNIIGGLDWLTDWPVTVLLMIIPQPYWKRLTLKMTWLKVSQPGNLPHLIYAGSAWLCRCVAQLMTVGQWQWQYYCSCYLMKMTSSYWHWWNYGSGKYCERWPNCGRKKAYNRETDVWLLLAMPLPSYWPCIVDQLIVY